MSSDKEFVWTKELLEEYSAALEKELFNQGALPEKFRKAFIKFKQQPQRIEVQGIDANWGKYPLNELYKDEPPYSHIIWTDKTIPEEKIPAIKNAISALLNNIEFHNYPTFHFETIKYPIERKYTIDDLRNAEEKAFNAARLQRPMPFPHEVYKNFQEYHTQKQK